MSSIGFQLGWRTSRQGNRPVPHTPHCISPSLSQPQHHNSHTSPRRIPFITALSATHHQAPLPPSSHHPSPPSMQLDSHRRQLSITMPCPWTRRCSAAESNTNADALPSPTSAQAVEDWKKIRRYNLRMMRKQVRVIVLLMALMEAIRVGPVQIVYAGRHGYPAPAEDDYGVCFPLQPCRWRYLGERKMNVDICHRLPTLWATSSPGSTSASSWLFGFRSSA